jgi:hypothetical protein
MKAIPEKVITVFPSSRLFFLSALTAGLLFIVAPVSATDGRDAYSENNLQIINEDPVAQDIIQAEDLAITTGNTPKVRLDQTNSSGFAPQIWDVAGNEANFFIRDVTGGSQYSFRIRPGAPTSSIDINASGNVGLGIASPEATLHIREIDAAENYLIKAEVTLPEEVDVFTVSRTGDTLILGNLDVGSSRNLKQNIKEVGGAEALSALGELTPVHFSYRSSPDVHSMGFIAEDVPAIVATRERKTLRPMDIVALLTKVTQEQQRTIEDLSLKVTALQQSIAQGYAD